MVVHDPFFWLSLILGIIFLLQLIGLAICIGPVYRAYRSMSGARAYLKQSSLRQKLGHG